MVQCDLTAGVYLADLKLTFSQVKHHFANHKCRGFSDGGHWKDKRDVYALSAIHGNVVADELPHKPELISDYNKFMGGVDDNDQLLAYFAVGRKTMKWWKRRDLLWSVVIFFIN